GEIITYTLTVHNAGPSPASFVVVNDTPTNLTIQSLNVSGGGSCASFPCSMTNPPIMVLGNTRTITVTAKINAAGAFDNSATANGNDFDPNTSNNTDNTGNGGLAVAAADVSMVKTLTTSGPFTVGQSVTYTLVVANAGPSTATNIVVNDTPTNLTITNVSGSGCSTPFPCTISSLASGANTTITVTAAINAIGTFDNSATATATEFDPNIANNTDNTGNGGTAAAAGTGEVTTTKPGSPATAGVGQTYAYTLPVHNNGPQPATVVAVSDALPATFTLLTATPTQGSCSGSTTVTCNIGTM